MSTVSLGDFLREIGMEDDVRVEKAIEDVRSSLPLAALRIAAKRTQAQLADALGVSQAAVSKFEGRGDFLLSTLFRYAQALNARVELSVQLDETTFDLAPYDDEGDMYFRLAKRHAKKVAHAHMLSSIRSLGEARAYELPGRHQPFGWIRFREGDYTSAPSITSELAANDEAQPLAA